jgi:hypothetical protein
LPFAKQPHALCVEAGHDNHDSFFGRRRRLRALLMNGTDNEFVGRRRRWQSLIHRNRQFLIELREVLPELPVGIAARQNDVSAPLRTRNRCSYSLQRSTKFDAAMPCFVNRVDEEPTILLRRNPRCKAFPVSRPQGSLKSTSRDIFKRGVERRMTGSKLLSRTRRHFSGLAAAGLGQKHHTAQL